MAFKLPGFGGKKTNIKEDMDRKYGHGDFASKEKRMKPGESKFNYDVRMRKEGRKATSTKPGSTYQAPDPKSEISIEGADTPSWEYKTQERNPGDLREQSRRSTSILPSAPGDEWTYKLKQRRDQTPVILATDKHGKTHNIEPGSDSDKAIRERYTASETGDLSGWYGHDTSGYTGSYDWDPDDDTVFAENYSSTDFDKKSYLPYDLAQKHYNPKYKGSKK